jgi:hypothetical protein
MKLDHHQGLYHAFSKLIYQVVEYIWASNVVSVQLLVQVKILISLIKNYNP